MDLSLILTGALGGLPSPIEDNEDLAPVLEPSLELEEDIGPALPYLEEDNTEALVAIDDGRLSSSSRIPLRVGSLLLLRLLNSSSSLLAEDEVEEVPWSDDALSKGGLTGDLVLMAK